MSEYYKYQFALYVDTYLKELKITALPSLQVITKDEVEFILLKFLDSYFPDLSDNFTDKEGKDELVRSLAAILFSHRYDKKDMFILQQKEVN